MYSNPSHGGNVGSRWAEVQRQQEDIVRALQEELAAAKATIQAQKDTLDSYQQGSYIVVTATRDDITPDVEGFLTEARARIHALAVVQELTKEGLDGSKADVTLFHVTAPFGHVQFVASYL